MVVSSGPEGIVLSDGYVLPPPPTMGTPVLGVWRDQATLIMSKDAQLPARCVKCNAPALGPGLKKRLTWHHPAIYLLILVALLIYFVVAMVLRKTAIVELGLCEEHRSKHRRNVLIGWSLLLLGLVGFVMAVMLEDTNFLLAGFLMIIAGIICFAVAVRIVSPARIDDKFAWLKGFNKDYLDELPQWPGG
jgi:hypothetical protein